MKTSLLLSVLLQLPLLAFADSVYPTQSPARIFGSNQSKVGSCASEARVTALEHYFAHLGMPIKLSLHHFHAALRSNLPAEQQADFGLKITPESKVLINRFGPLVPEYMQPEDGEGTSREDIADVRLPLEMTGIYDPTFISPTEYRYTEEYRLFDGGYRNSSNIDHLKNLLRSHVPVVLHIDSTILQPTMGFYDDVTGLPKNAAALKMEKINHDVAVVGFDDDLQSFIIRNTWNDRAMIAEVSRPEASDGSKNPDLLKLRLKIAHKNLPGYYAIPYSVVSASAGLSGNGFTILGVNAAAFGNSYFAHANDYEVRIAPYICRPKLQRPLINRLTSAYQDFKSYPEGSEPRKKAARIMFNVINDQVSQQRPLYGFAKLPALKSSPYRNIMGFYVERYFAYYCGAAMAEGNKYWPQGLIDGDFMLRGGFDSTMQQLSENPRAFMSWRDFFHLNFYY